MNIELSFGIHISSDTPLLIIISYLYLNSFTVPFFTKEEQAMNNALFIYK